MLIPNTFMQFTGCTCCDLSVTRSLQVRLQHLAEDLSFSRSCLNSLKVIHCMVCDPLVGVGLTTAICPSLCDEWFHQCQNDYFLFKHENLT